MHIRAMSGQQTYHAIRSARRQLTVVVPTAARPTPNCPDLRSAADVAQTGVRPRIHFSGREREADLSFVRSACAVTTGSATFPRFAIVDRQAIVLASVGHDYTGGATVIVESALARLMEQAVRNDARHATTPPQPVTGDGVTLQETERAVLAQLITGTKDELAARDLGMATRTYRRVVARLLHLLRADSRFQAGFRAGQLNLL
ncbi:hypothetical protein [Streptomyces koyangensis]|uniref:hypothetical protein n=1 Tax=Streptomyces koyangensis TaxID=188770 RepID=UPI003C30418A